MPRDPYANYNRSQSGRSTSSDSIDQPSSSRHHHVDRSRRSSNHSSSRASRSRGGHGDTSTAASSVIDPNMPKWWNDKKKAARNANRSNRSMASSSRHKPGAHIMSDESIAKARLKSGIDYGVGAHQYYDEDSTYARKVEKKFKGSGGSVAELKDERIARGITADEELQGRKLTDLIDRGTLAVGACLILIVIIAVTIPVVLISEEEPYVALAAPDPPTASPTMKRQMDYWPIYDRLVNIAGGDEVLSDTSTAQNRAWNWLVYEDGFELGASKDHLHQRFVLMVIYFISGPWTPVEGTLEWGSPVHECEWEGVFCKDVEELEKELEGRVDELMESGEDNGVKIDVPQRVINELHLRQRLVSGEVPAEFSLLYYLQHLDLENNQLVGVIPTPLYKLLNLKTLFLEQNELTNVDAIGEYKFLEHVALGKNAFRGALPESFSNLKNLKTLYLHTNAWTGQVFDILKDFKSLEFVDIAFNEFEGTLPTELGDMVNLTSVFLGHNRFEGNIPDEIGNCKKLKEFQVDGLFDVGGKIPTVLGQLTSLELLKLDTCAFTGVLPKQLGNLKNLTFLDVSSNSLQGEIPTELGKMTNIKTLGLANNDFSGTVPTEFGYFKDLEKLYLQNTDLSGVMPQEICALRSGNDTKIEAIEVPCDVECNMDDCCTMCGR